MVSGVIEIPSESALYPSGLRPFFDNSPPKLWYTGDLSLLKGKILGILSARKMEPDLALKTSELLRQLGSLDATFISGWHSPLEEEVLRILLSRSLRVIFCLAKSLDKFVCSAEVENLLGQGRGLLLTHCSTKAKRLSRDASLRRNLLVLGLSKGLLVLSAPEGSASFKLAHKAVKLGRPVFTPQHRINDSLLASGALPATVENIQRVFQ
jgi:predicted Rossmann fold nucleotide-binding protein DprA/Smf involved in DNA uptake